MVNGRWLVLVDVAPATVRDSVDRALRDTGFVEVMPCVYRSRWMEPDLLRLKRALRQAKRKGVGRVAVGRLDAKGLLEI
jgi:hypothetical protein